MNSLSVVHSDPEIMGGTPVFRGTRAPFQTLIDYLEVGHPLADFLDDFPTVSREQVISALELSAHRCRLRHIPLGCETYLNASTDGHICV